MAALLGGGGLWEQAEAFQPRPSLPGGVAGTAPGLSLSWDVNKWWMDNGKEG